MASPERGPNEGALTPAVPAQPVPVTSELSTRLGIEGKKRFLLQHELLARGHIYRVLGPEKKLFFTVEEDIHEELEWLVLGQHPPQPPAQPAPEEGPRPAPAVALVWSIVDSSGVPQAKISVEAVKNSTVSTVREISGVPVFAVGVSSSLLGDVNVTAAFPDGRPMFQSRENLLRHDFTVQDPSGKDIAKIHEAWVSAHDTYDLELGGDVDPLGPLVLAIVIDRMKGKG